ncbi:MAG: elongation factor G [Candidatus Izimaplasma sp.]|nr:elongation factor G [Candidatus Izimaplasma bacterium]
MKQYDVENLRSVTVIGHQGSGKTSLMESILYVTGAKEVKGKVDTKNTASDYLEEEKNHQSSLSMSLIPAEYEGYKFNFLDTIGHKEFSSEIYQSLRAAKGAILMIDGSHDIDLRTEQLIELLHDKNVPTIIFINKMDKENVKFDKLMEKLQEMVGNVAVPFLWPIVEDDSFEGFINLIEMKERVLENGKVVQKPIPDKYKDLVSGHREKITEAVAETSEALLDKYFAGEELTYEEISGGLRDGIIAGDLMPVLSGSVEKNIGIKDLLEMIIQFMPAANDLKPKPGVNPKTDEKESRKTVKDEPFSAYVFKTIIDPFIGTMNFIKVYSGSVKKDDKIYVSNLEDEVKVNAFSYIRGKEQLDADELSAGDIGILIKLDGIETGATLSDPKAKIVFKKAFVPSPTHYVAIKPKQKRDEDKISSALKKLKIEDPSFDYKRNRETAQLLIGGQGMSQINHIIEKMENRYKVEVGIHDQKIVYRETIKRTTEAQGRHKKQSGGSGQFGVVDIRFKPMNPNEVDFEFDEEIHGGSVPKGYFPAVEKGLKEIFEKGPLAGFPVIGIKAILYDGSYHDVDSNEISFKIAAALAYKEACKSAKPTLLEPIMKLEIVIKDDYVGDVIGDINKRRGKVLGMEPLGNGKQQVNAEIPEAEIISYTIDLNAMTQGTGEFTREFVRYEEVPNNLQTKIIETSKQDDED